MKRPRQKLLSLLAAGCLLSVPAAVATEAVPLLSPGTSMTEDWPEWRWTVLAGDDALNSGLPSLAERLYLRALEQPLPTDLREAVELKLVSSLIAERRFAEASRRLEAMGESEHPGYDLRLAIVKLNQGDLKGSEAAIGRVDPEVFSRAERPWYYLTRGLLAGAQEQRGQSVGWLEQAMESSVSPGQKAQFEALLFSSRLGESKATEEQARLLQRKLNENRGTRAGFSYAREYAVVLDRLGDKARALEILQAQLALITASELDEKAQTLLLVGLIAGPESRRGQLALEEILRIGQGSALQRVALYLLAESAWQGEGSGQFQQFLETRLREADGALVDEMIMLQARLHLQAGERGRAAAAAERLLAEYPASPLGEDARWILAYLAWQERRYRSAADFLQQILERLPPGDDRNRVGQLIGDCYFLNGDYPVAADVYRGVLNQVFEGGERPELAYQAVLAEIRSGRLDEAVALLDRAGLLGLSDPIRLWRAEWNLVEALRREKRGSEGLDRLTFKLQSEPFEVLEAGLRLRLMWLAAYLSFEEGNYQQGVSSVDQALELIGEDSDLPQEERAILAASLLLLQGQALMRTGQAEGGQAVFQRLRSDYSGSEAAVQSYLIEARFLAAEFRLVEAQRRLRELADLYPESPHAPTALLEAATLAEQQGQTRNFEEARDILRVLLERYPRHPLVFHAKLQLGNLARKMNQFGAAQLLYENILQEFAGRSREFPLYLAELYRADTLLAQAGGQVQRLDAAAAALDRVLDEVSSPVSVRVEAGYKLALIQVQQGKRAQAREMLWLLVTRYLNDPAKESQLGPKGRFWISRALLELGELLEQNQEVRQAREVYRMISAHDLPGQAVARTRAEY